MEVKNLPTPALILDFDAFEENVQTMMKQLEGTGIRVRPHYKSFKSTRLAHYLMDHGAKGIICAKLSEAEDLIYSGIENVLIGNQVTDPAKIARLAYLAGCCCLTVCIDSRENAADLQKACALAGTKLHVLVEYDVGMDRCGVFTKEDFLALARYADSCENLLFDGIQAYAGNLAHEFDYETRKAKSEEVEEVLKDLKQYAESNGLPIREISGISTGTIEFHGKRSVYTEAQTGSFLFMDKSYEDVGAHFKNSLFMLTSIISKNDHAIVMDAGVKSLGMDQREPYYSGFEKEPVIFSEEHTSLRIKTDLKVGDKLRIVPGHCCTTVNLQDKMYLVRGEKVIDCIPVTGRGKSV